MELGYQAAQTVSQLPPVDKCSTHGRAWATCRNCRDEFARAALTGIVPQMGMRQSLQNAHDVAFEAYAVADACMAERSRGK